jgi:hypothetical protein
MRLIWFRTLAAAFVIALVASLCVYPLADTWLGLTLAAYALLLWWRPHLWLLALPALLPVLDLAPRTGWFFLEEIDLLLMLTAAFAYWHAPANEVDQPDWPLLFRCGLFLLAVACLIGTWRGLQPLSPPDINTYSNYLSPGNALRIAKGWLWALVLLPPLKQAAGGQLQGLRTCLIPGMMLGWLLVSAAAIQERWQFPGLLNFSSDYRISAPFSAMHTGGAALDGYLALCTPLLVIWLLERGTPWRNVAALALLALALYVGLATFSRGLYLALAVAVLILVSPALRIRPVATLTSAAAGLAALDIAFRAGGYRLYGAVLLALGTLLMALLRHYRIVAMAGLLLTAATVPIFHGYYVNERFSKVGNDWRHRLQHWRQSLAMMDADSAVLGMGLGTFPATYYWHNPLREVPPSYRFIGDNGHRHLRLAAGEYAAGYGELLRIWQIVRVQPHQRYRLGIDVRNLGAPGFLHIHLCQRQLLYPQRCAAVPLKQISYTPDWQHYQYSMDAGVLGADRLPVTLEIAAEGKQVVLDVDKLSLRAEPDGPELLHNGDFSHANDYWFFSSDRNHLPWHIKNLALNLYFEMGWLGVSAYLLMLLSVAAVLLQRRDTAWLASLAAFQVVGLFDSLIDVPRITLLFTLLLCAAALQPRNPP